MKRKAVELQNKNRGQRKQVSLPTYQGQLIQDEIRKNNPDTERIEREKQEKVEKQKLLRSTLSALIKRALKAESSERSSKHAVVPVPQEYIEALRIHCAHHSQSYDEQSIYQEFFSVIERELSLEHNPLACLYLLDSFVHDSETLRGIVEQKTTKFIGACDKAGIFRVNLSNLMKETLDYLLEMADIWSSCYGKEHKSFVMLQRYLRETLQLNAPTIEERIIQYEQRQHIAKEKQWKDLVNNTERIIHRSWPDAAKEITALIQRLEESFHTIVETSTKPSANLSLHLQPSSSTEAAIHKAEEVKSPEPSSSQQQPESEWDNIEWESDDITTRKSEINDDNSVEDIDLFGEELLYASAVLTGDITVTIDPTRLPTYRGDIREEDKIEKEKFQREIRDAVQFTAKHLLGLHKLLVKWDRYLQSFLSELVLREENYQETTSFWKTHKRRRILVDDGPRPVETTTVSTSGAAAAPSSPPFVAAVAVAAAGDGTRTEMDKQSNDESDLEHTYRVIFGHDRALLERLTTSAVSLLETDLPSAMQRIRSILENQVREYLAAK